MRNKTLISIFLLCVAFFLINFFSRKKLNNSYAYQLSYDQLYINDSSFYIKKIGVNKQNNFLIEFGGTNYLLHNINVTDSANHPISQSEDTYEFLPKEGDFTVDIKNKQNDSLITSFIVRYTPSQIYALNGHRAFSDYQLLHNALPLVNFPIQPISQWVQLVDPLKNKGIVDEKLFVKDTLEIADHDVTIEKLKKCFAYIMPITEGHSGIPADSLANIHPYFFLQAVKNNKTRLWCGNYAAILNWVCFEASVQTRLIGTFSSGSHLGNHTFCEVFIPEIRKWILSDPTNGIAYIKSGKYYFNAVDLYRFFKLKSEDSTVVAGFFDKGEFSEVSLISIKNKFEQFYNQNNEIWFYYSNYLKHQQDNSIKRRLLNFVNPKPNYAFYSDSVTDVKYEFYLRVVSGYLFIIFLALTCIAVITKIYTRIKN